MVSPSSCSSTATIDLCHTRKPGITSDDLRKSDEDCIALRHVLPPLEDIPDHPEDTTAEISVQTDLQSHIHVSPYTPADIKGGQTDRLLDFSQALMLAASLDACQARLRITDGKPENDENAASTQPSR